ncbi:MAG: acyl-CoA thioesterase [Coxiella sp. RIFCSPHIGHO2_12_FULL_44_14]|nr:MAG: acyl-CoA thioesterase [Coxiella sp. RIFCSPHIGHO2_12_FULL_44_14]
MTPEKVNFAGNIHGGYLLKLIDQAAYACAARYCGCYVVTLSVDRVLFKEPIYVGELVTCHASVNFVGTTSLEVGIKVIAENLSTQKRRHTNSCYLTMVAVDENLKPVRIKPLTLTNDIERRRFAEAKIRRETRMVMAREHAKRKKS